MKRLVELLRAVVAAIIIAGLLVGVPMALALVVGLPTEEVSNLTSGSLLSDERRVGSILSVGLTAVFWLAWAQTAWALLVELWAAARGTVAGRSALVPGVQKMAQYLVASLLLISSMSASGRSPSLPVAPVDGQVTHVDVTPVGGGASFDSSVVVTEPLGRSPYDSTHERTLSVEQVSGGDYQPSAVQTYEVGAGDTFWSIAEAKLGDGMRWSELRRYNIGQVMADGDVITPTTESITPGWVLRLPDQSGVADGDRLGLDELPFQRVVQEGDSFWLLAEEELRSTLGRQPSDAEIAAYWGELVATNEDSLMPPGDPDLIFPGQVVELPDQADHTEDGEQPVDKADVPATSVREALKTGRLARPLPPLVTPAPAEDPGTAEEGKANGDAVAQDDPGTVDRSADSGPGGSDEVPVIQSADLVEAADDQPEGPSIEASPPVVTLDTPATPNGAGISLIAAAATGGGGLFMAAGVGLAMRRGRRFRLAQRSPGHRPADPPAELFAVQRAVSVASDAPLVEWLPAALNSLGGRVAWPGEEVAQPLVAELGPERLVVHMTGEDEVGAPLPWSESSSTSWSLERGTPLEQLGVVGRAETAPCFAFIGEGVAINLEAVGVLAVRGEPHRVQALVTNLMHQLAYPTRGRCLDLRTTLELGGPNNLPGVRRQNPDELPAEIAAWSQRFQERMVAVGATSSYSYRLLRPEESVDPLVVIVGPEDSMRLEPVLRLAHLRQLPLTVVVVASSMRGAEVSNLEVVFGDGSARLEPLGIEFDPALASPLDGEVLAHLLDDQAAEVPASSPVEASETPGSELGAVQQSADAAPSLPVDQVAPMVEAPPVPETESEPAGPRVCVLGPIEVVGLAEDQSLTPQQQSLVAFLSVSGGASREVIEDALWDGQAVAETRLPNLLAEVRSRLGRNHLPEAANGRYQLVDVGSDLSEFERRVEAGERASTTAEAISALEAALGLVRGAPFAAPSRRFWTWVGDVSHHMARAEAMIADAACRLARLHEDAGDWDRAQEICEHGLKAAPLDEALVAQLARIYVRLGRSTTAHRLVSGWEEAISRLDIGEPSEIPRRMLGD